MPLRAVPTVIPTSRLLFDVSKVTLANCLVVVQLVFIAERLDGSVSGLRGVGAPTPIAMVSAGCSLLGATAGAPKCC